MDPRPNITNYAFTQQIYLVFEVFTLSNFETRRDVTRGR